ncbi:sulfatase-like hydrolase/transferase [Candidatus Saccharibacteria bacterium]|nr:sulfatase-like hydrolase/transferase [Candidatus Saccharibacteria bacterium]
MNKRLILKIILNVALIFVGALFLTWFLEYRYFINNSGSAFNFVFERPKVFFFSALVIAIILIFIYALTFRPCLSISIVWTIIIILTYIHINKYVSRGSPLLPEDFQLADQAGQLAKFIDIGALIRMILACILSLFVGGFLDYKTRSILRFSFPENLPFWMKRMVIPRVAIMGAMIGLFFVTTDFARNHAGIAYQNIEWLDTSFTAWNQNKNYDDNGFLFGFLYNLKKVSLEEPEGYSEEKINAIYNKYSDEKNADDKNRTDLKDTDYNIVVILDESFYDPELIREYYNYATEDVTPNWHKIAASYPSGYMYSPEYGGGTANVEFEVFTGLSNYWANTVPYTDIFPRLESVDSIASWAKTAGGYKNAVTLHPFNGGMYKRDIALKVEGYDDFVDITRFDFTEHDDNSQYINDRSSYQEALKTLRENPDKQMIELITMQNHLPYNYDNYNNHDFEVSGEADNTKRDIETYLQSLHNSDKYLGEFIDELSKMDEKTVVLLFGDHSPGIFAKTNGSSSAAERNITQLTPYFIYTNFDYDFNLVKYASATDELPEKVSTTTLPTTTPNCLSNTLYNVLGVKKPVLGYLLDDVCKDAPVLTAKYLNGKEIKTEAVENYKQVVYDILGGQRFWK